MFLGVFASCEEDCPDCTGLSEENQILWDSELHDAPSFCDLTDDEAVVMQLSCELYGGTWE